MAKTVLQGTADTLESFGLGWAWAPLDAEQLPAKVQAVIVASPDGELPGRWSRETGRLTIRVPVEGAGRNGLDLLNDEAGRLPVGPADGVFATMAIGAAGAKNAALFVVAVLAVQDEALRARWTAFRERQTTDVLAGTAPTLEG